MSNPTAIPLIDENSLDDIMGASQVPVLVYVWAEWCGPCQYLGPHLEQVTAELGDSLHVVKIDFDTSPQTQEKYGISGIPELLLFTGGELVARLVGGRDADDLRSQLRPLLQVRSTGEATAVAPRDEDGPEPRVPAGWTPRGPRILTFPDDLPGKLAIFDGWIPDRGESEIVAAQGTIEVAEDRVVWLMLQQPGNEENPDAPANPVDLGFLRQLPADGIDKLLIAAPAISSAGLADIAHLTGLTRLSVNAQTLVGSTAEAAAALAGLTRLDEVHLTIPEADDAFVTQVAGLSQLQELWVTADGVTDSGVAQLARARGLRCLMLNTPSVSDAGLAELAEADLPELTTLWLHMPETTDEGLVHVAKLTGLRILSITAPKATPAGLRRLTALSGLTTLGFGDTPVDDEVVTALASLTELQSLGLEGEANVSEAAYLHLRSALPSLKINGVWVAPQAVRHALDAD
ncbi:thioredoxin domain-containing protein [Streptomyces sp. NPDC007162]|uniref:thioredoxin domain-containing protein n=1 Tax=Streptomyces sp. NPDC007162 TaxID=3156917 RepID=UPI0033D0D1AA